MNAALNVILSPLRRATEPGSPSRSASHGRNAWWITAALCALIALTGCASHSHSRPGLLGNVEGSGALGLRAQLDALHNDPAPADARRVIFVGAALNGREDVFDRDIRLLDATLRGVYGDAARSVLLSNVRVFEGQRSLPLATIEHLDQVFEALQKQRRAGDRYVLLLSTHGTPGMLEVEQAARYQQSRLLVTAKLRAWLQQLSPRPTWLVISACFAGSHLGRQAPAHVITMAAAAADRPSFGCSNTERNTWFVEALDAALKAAPLAGAASFDAVWQRTTEQISRREAEGRFQPSLPQWQSGAAMQDKRRAPVADF